MSSIHAPSDGFTITTPSDAPAHVLELVKRLNAITPTMSQPLRPWDACILERMLAFGLFPFATPIVKTCANMFSWNETYALSLYAVVVVLAGVIVFTYRPKCVFQTLTPKQDALMIQQYEKLMAWDDQYAPIVQQLLAQHSNTLWNAVAWKELHEIMAYYNHDEFAPNDLATDEDKKQRLLARCETHDIPVNLQSQSVDHTNNINKIFRL